ncbi:hypothetical protein NAEGRDRAFT_78936 [Naegleria gruberi]|uniref:Uncharacterized protein n=1 Tax=Naegleria gruberi TaxID=5762 RepID=D2V7T8_NAEGR|nr:uncharacterized protein NAEGRDRAFT_78936 [Naegleria gruberi]EFC46928.1 hypothetical protein NAEGRDRAFT_78936 [Naegleria gruberi]|eukprot:XP_002679672.1 hypothetical protein NAEGRDRAFT_78936 [Naegleria gruberi strain NEG-M]
MYKNLINITSFAIRKSSTTSGCHKAGSFVMPTVHSYHHSFRNRDLERVASCVGHSQDVTVDQSNLSYSIQQLIDKLEKLAKLDPQLKKILQDYSSDVSMTRTARMNKLTAQRLFECNLKVQHYLSAHVGTQELRFLSMVNSDLADECSVINKRLQKHIFST